jgi:putative endonuclease
VEVVYLESGHSRGSASRREAAIKKLPRCDKINLLNSPMNELACAGSGGQSTGFLVLPGHS